MAECIYGFYTTEKLSNEVRGTIKFPKFDTPEFKEYCIEKGIFYFRRSIDNKVVIPDNSYLEKEGFIAYRQQFITINNSSPASWRDKIVDPDSKMNLGEYIKKYGDKFAWVTFNSQVYVLSVRMSGIALGG